ncbi:U-box domain-containing protein [Legionella parisiensis]|uniref:U-box domain-containing protein n=1 Tax=Legionella parisiensis TaxID=45071 RepID=UPI0010569600|nr:U-box domain-containing protein [Legionella parisiensis]
MGAKEIFEAINTGEPLLAIQYLKDNPSLVQVKDEKYGSNVLMAAIFNLANTKDDKKREQFIQLIHHIIDNPQLDLSASNKGGNTALHQIFWYAIKKPYNDPVFRDQLINVGLKLIERIKGSSNFLAIMSQVNNNNETFLDNIDVAPYLIEYDWQQQNMAEVQKAVYPLLQKYAVQDVKNAENNFDFTQNTFLEHLEEILADISTYEVMEDPVLLTNSGHSVSKSTWDELTKKGGKNPFNQAPTAPHEVHPNTALKKVIGIYNYYKAEGEEKVFAELSRYLKKYEGPAKALVYNDLALRGVISLVSQYKNYKEQELLKKQQPEKQQEKAVVKMPEHKSINWMAPSLPDAVTHHPLWAFHQAISQSQSTDKNFDQKKLWALASIKSLIEIDINRQFVIEAGLAYERDVDNGVYIEEPPNSGMYKKKAGATAQFDAFRSATGVNAQHGDSAKADTLRTSEMHVAHGKTEFVSYHPSISYPTGDLPQDKRRASKEQQMDYFYNGLLHIWHRIEALPTPADRQKCIQVFCSHVKIDGIGCANERLVDAIDRMAQTLIQFESKKLPPKNFADLVNEVTEALNNPVGEPNLVFDKIFKQYSGFTIEGENWVIGVDTKERFAQKIIDEGIAWMLLDNDKSESYKSNLLNPPKKEGQQHIVKQPEPPPPVPLVAQKEKKELIDKAKSFLSSPGANIVKVIPFVRDYRKGDEAHNQQQDIDKFRILFKDHQSLDQFMKKYDITGLQLGNGIGKTSNLWFIELPPDKIAPIATQIKNELIEQAKSFKHYLGVVKVVPRVKNYEDGKAAHNDAQPIDKFQIEFKDRESLGQFVKNHNITGLKGEDIGTTKGSKLLFIRVPPDKIAPIATQIKNELIEQAKSFKHYPGVVEVVPRVKNYEDGKAAHNDAQPIDKFQIEFKDRESLGQFVKNHNITGLKGEDIGTTKGSKLLFIRVPPDKIAPIAKKIKNELIDQSKFILHCPGVKRVLPRVKNYEDGKAAHNEAQPLDKFQIEFKDRESLGQFVKNHNITGLKDKVDIGTTKGSKLWFIKVPPEKIARISNQIKFTAQSHSILHSPGVLGVAPLVKNSEPFLDKFKIVFKDKKSFEQFINDHNIEPGHNQGKANNNFWFLDLPPNRITPIFQKLEHEILNGRYAHYATDNGQNRKDVDFVVEPTDSLKTKYKTQKGDFLKSTILKDFYEDIEMADSEEEVQRIVDEYKTDGRYDILATAQRSTVQMFKRFLNTSSENAFENIRKLRLDEISASQMALS